jgi:hypothetical protein
MPNGKSWKEMKMESINKQLAMLERKKEVLNTRENPIDIIRVVGDIVNIYIDLGETQKAINLRVLLTQLELQNEALISRMKTIINE